MSHINILMLINPWKFNFAIKLYELNGKSEDVQSR